jgi:hypothetical protein
VNAIIRAALLAVICVTVLVRAAIRRAFRVLRHERAAPTLPRRPRTVPGLRADGEALTFREQRALADVEMDSLIDIPEPTYGPGAERGTT